MFETHLELNRSKDTSITAFEGIIITLSMNKEFNGKTILKKDFGTMGNWTKKKNIDLERVRLEDPRFERFFEVYSSDQIEARYLLTPAFMDRLLQLIEVLRERDEESGALPKQVPSEICHYVECSFYDNKLLITIQSFLHDFFEVDSIFEPVDFVDETKKILEEMNLIFQIVDVLKLDSEIGI